MNNYDTSSSGISIEAMIGKDIDLARDNWRENFIAVQDDVFQYIDYGNVNGFDDIYELIEVTEDNIVTLLDALVKEGWSLSDFARDYEVSTLVETLLEDFQLQDYEEAIDLLNKYDISFEKNYEVIYTRGVCQGDYAEVLIPIKQLRECWCISDDIKDKDLVSTEYIDQVFWECPITIRIDINGEEYIDDLDGQYNYYNRNTGYTYNKAELIDRVIKYFPELDEKLLQQELNKVLPEEIM
jgi:hypothetical protein